MSLEVENQRLQEQLAEREQTIEQLESQLCQQSLLMQQMREQIVALNQQVKDLQDRLAKDSHKSSLPPSSDRFGRQRKNLRKKSEKKSGGQEGHAGTTLRFSEKPDEVIEHQVSVCASCQQDLRQIEACVTLRRQVVDLPSPQLIVQEHCAEQKQCPRCQQMSVASFPTSVTAPIQYGPRIGAMAVYLSQQQLLPLQRTTEVLADLLGVQMSEATVGELIQRTASQLAPVEQQIKMEYHHRPIRTTYQHASKDIIATCLAQIEQQNREMRSLNCLHLVEACWDNQLEEALLDKARENALDPNCLREVLRVILTHDPAAANTIAETMFQEAYIKGDYERATVIAGNLIANIEASWVYLWSLLAHDDAFGRALLLGLQRTEAFEHTLTQHLPPRQIADLFLRVVELFPPAEDPPGPNGVVSDRQLLSMWRSQLITSLQQRGTREGFEALRTISLAHPEMEWIRWVLINAERLVRRRTWTGFNPKEILSMTHDKERRLVQNGEQLLAVVTESLVRLQETLHGETPARIFLWDVLPPGAEGQKRYRPKDENLLSDYVKLHLEHDLKQRGIIVLREVEIRRAAGGAPGERTDLYVDAYVPGPDHAKVDILTVIIEVKGCWHREVNTAMQTQLVERYLRDNPGRHGLYLVGWFNCPQWNDPDDHRKNDAPQITLASVRTQFAQQAEALTAQLEGKCLIKSFVLDTALR